MTTQANFTPNEWKILKDAPVLVGEAVAAVSPSGVMGTLKEGAAIATGVMNSARQHPGNQLVQDVAPRGIDAKQAIAWAQSALGVMRGSDAENIKRQGLDACRQVSQILAQKSPPQEANDYKHWLLEVGEGVARAAKERGNEPVSPEEERALDEMSAVLNVAR